MEKTFRKHITVFAGSADGLPESHLKAAWHLGATLARQERTMVYGAGSTGLMGAVANGVLDNKGQVIGVINDGLNLEHLIHNHLSSLETVRDIQTRQKRMLDLADGIIALPGGYGTYYETVEALTWAQIGLHRRPIGLLNIEGYFDPFVKMIEHSIDLAYIYPEHRGLFVVSEDHKELLQMLDNFIPPKNMNRWLDRT